MAEGQLLIYSNTYIFFNVQLSFRIIFRTEYLFCSTLHVQCKKNYSLASKMHVGSIKAIIACGSFVIINNESFSRFIARIQLFYFFGLCIHISYKRLNAMIHRNCCFQIFAYYKYVCARVLDVTKCKRCVAWKECKT